MTAYTRGAKRRAKKKRPSREQAKEMLREAHGIPDPEREEKNFGPTRERAKRGKYVVSDGRVYQDEAATPLRWALKRGKLTLAQVEAGEHVEAVWRALNGSTGRSCLDIDPRGGGEMSAERAARLKARLNQFQSVTGEAWPVVWQVSVMHEPIGDCRPSRRRFRHLFDGLAALVRLSRVAIGA